MLSGKHFKCYNKYPCPLQLEESEKVNRLLHNSVKTLGLVFREIWKRFSMGLDFAVPDLNNIESLLDKYIQVRHLSNGN